MKMLSVKEASGLTNISEQTIRNWAEEGKITKHEDNNGKLVVDKRELLLQIPTSITLFNQKGGVGKTSVSVILSDYFEKKGLNVLLIDLDQQGNLSQTFFKYEDIKDSPTLFDYFYNKTPLQKILRKYNENIDVLPADIKLSRKDNISVEDLIDLKNDFTPLFKKYNVVIIDCPPALNSFSRFGLLLSNYVFCPVHPSAYSFDGAFEVLRTIKKFVPQLNTDCIDYKFIISKHHYKRYVIKDEYVELFKEEFGDKLYQQSIPEFIGIEERAVSFTNIFDMYTAKTDKSIKKIWELCEEIDRTVYENRG